MLNKNLDNLDTPPTIPNLELEQGKKIHTTEPQEIKKPGHIMNFLKKIRDLYRPAIIGSSKPKQTQELIEKMQNELAEVEKLDIREGVNFSKCQMDKIVEDYKNGRSVEIDVFSPYLQDHNMATGEIKTEELNNVENIGLSLGGLLKKIFPKSVAVSLYDEYNCFLPGASDYFRIPLGNAPKATFSEEAKKSFKSNVEKLLRQFGVINKNDKEGENYLLISESSKIESAEKLVEELDRKGKIKREGRSIYFINPEAENPAYREILLRTENNHWVCEALDASSFLDKKNLKITHLVILPNSFIEQQDKVWEMLRILGIDSSNYHNIFYEENLPPEQVTRVVSEEIKKYF